jgi:hypothetical protein
MRIVVINHVTLDGRRLVDQMRTFVAASATVDGPYLEMLR